MVELSSSAFQPAPAVGTGGGSAPGASFDSAALEELLQKLVSAQLAAFEAKLEKSLGTRLDSLETRLKELNKVVPAAAASSSQPSNPENSQKVEGALEKTNSRLDQISAQLEAISSKIEPKGEGSRDKFSWPPKKQ